jgi:hypothetical protein
MSARKPVGGAAPGGQRFVKAQRSAFGLAVHPADKGCSVCAGKAFFQMRDLAQVAADAIQHKGPPSAAFAAVQAVSLQNQDRKFYANCANPVCLA